MLFTQGFLLSDIKGTKPVPVIITISLLISIAYISGYVSIWLSLFYQFYDSLVSWYFPHAVRILALLVLPFRYWAIFLFFTILGSDSYYHINMSNDEGVTLKSLFSLSEYYFMELCSGALVYILLKRYVHNWFCLKSVVMIIFLTILYRFLYLLIPAYFKLGFFSLLPEERYFELVVAIQVSGYLVGFYALAIAYIYKWWVVFKTKEFIKTHLFLFFQIILVLIFIISLHKLDENLEYILRIAILIPLIMISARKGLFSGIISVLTIVTGLFIILSDATSDDLIIYQPFIIMYLLISLIVSVVAHENAQINQYNHDINKNLKEKNKHLLDAKNRMTLLSRKIINVQEEERKFLSKELHDEIGQNIIALKSSIHLLETGTSQDIKHEIRALKEDANMIYSSVYELMHWLRPSILDKFGLYETLKGEFFKDKLAMFEIEYQSNLENQLALTEHVETTLFRICQEAINNTIKHSDATMLRINMWTDNNYINLRILDNGTGKTSLSENTGGFGLESIYERVLTLNGMCVFTDTNGFVIDIKIPTDSL